jgi:AraC-like DNA-binding protein
MRVVGRESGVLDKSISLFLTPNDGETEELFFSIPMCGRFYCTDKYMKKRITYPLQLVMHIISGVMHCEHMGRIFDAVSGDVVLMDCTQPHYYGAEDGLQFQFVHYSGSNSRDITRYLLGLYGPLIKSPANARIGDYISSLIEYYDGGGVGTLFNTSKQVYDLLHIIYECGRGESGGDDEIMRAIRYINDHFNERISLDELAEHVHLSKYYFAHRFKEIAGAPPVEYIIQARINHAKSLLVQTNKSIDDIAYEVGYSSSNSFSNVFTNKVGQSPRSFRKMMK